MSSDHHGTAQNLINAKNQTVTTRRTLPFGEVRGGTGTWPSWMDKGFVGGTLDNTGLTHIGARGYDPAIGRFISVDPLMDTANPQQWNGYAYANNAPITFSDPTGLISCPDGDCQNKGPSGGGRGVPVRKPTTKNHGHGIVETRDRHGNVSINGYQLPAKAPSVERLVRGMIARINAEPAWAWAPDPDGQLDLIKTLKALESACFELAECDSAIEQMFFNHGATVTGIEYGMEFAGAPLGPIGGVGRRYNETNLQQAGVPFSARGKVSAATKKITILGRHDEGVDAYIGKPGYNTLELPEKGSGKWQWSRNKKFIDDAIAGGGEIRLLHSPYTPMYESGNVYQRELRYLRDRGFTFEARDNYWVVTRGR